MVSGFEKYFQIVNCFRDEDLRADRQPEFTQIDIEMSFPRREALFTMIEGMMAKVFALKGIEIPTPLPRMNFQEAMERYGSDKPDTRFEVFLQDFTDIFKNGEAGVFREMAETGNTVRGLVAPKTAYSRKQLDDLALYREAARRGRRRMDQDRRRRHQCGAGRQECRAGRGRCRHSKIRRR